MSALYTFPNLIAGLLILSGAVICCLPVDTKATGKHARKVLLIALGMMIMLAGCDGGNIPETKKLHKLANAAEIEVASNSVTINGRAITIEAARVYSVVYEDEETYAPANGPSIAKAGLVAEGPEPFPGDILFLEMYVVRISDNLVWVDTPSIRYFAGAVDTVQTRIQDGPVWREDRAVAVIVRLMDVNTEEEYYVRLQTNVDYED